MSDLDKSGGFYAYRVGLCEGRLPCCCFDVVSLLSKAQSAVNSRLLIKQIFRDTFRQQRSGQPKLVGPPLLRCVSILPVHDFLTET